MFLTKVKRLFQTLLLSASLYACSTDNQLFNAPCQPDQTIKEICNNKDDNCDGKIDEECDVDGDGYCASEKLSPVTDADFADPAHLFYQQPEFVCPKSYVTGNCMNAEHCIIYYGDCDDHNPLIFPSNTERCNGFDDDCDGQTDNVFPEKGMACYLNTLSGEIVDATSVDTSSPVSLENLCGPSTYICSSGQLECANLGVPEICDGIDNNCNTLIDELISAEPCYGGWGEVDGLMEYIDGLQRGSPWYGTLGVGECWGGNFTCTQSCEMLPEYVTSCQPYAMGGDQLCNDAITPLPEICNGRNDDCDLDGIDEDYDQDSDTYTTCGTFARQMESMTLSSELIDCDDTDAEVNPGMLEIICNGKDDDCNSETIDATDLDEDAYPIDCAPAIPVDCDDNPADDPEFCAYVSVEDCFVDRFSACAPCINPAAPEKCGDCRDNNCNGEVDENAVEGTSQAFVVIDDCSGSMGEENNSLTEAVGRILWPECFPAGQTSISTVFVQDGDTDQPRLAGIGESGAEFRDNFAARVPASCSSNEDILDALSYIFCSFPEERFAITPTEYLSEYIDLCLPLQMEYIAVSDSSGGTININPIQDLLAGNELSDLLPEGSAYHILLLGDEDAQSKFSYVDQWKVGQLARHLGFTIGMYINPSFFTTTTLGGASGGMGEGYAYLICDAYDADMHCIGNSNGTMTDINLWVYSGDIGTDLVDRFTAADCPTEEE